MDNKQIYKATLCFSIRRILWEILGLIVLSALILGGFYIADKATDKGLVGLVIGGIIGIVFGCAASQIIATVGNFKTVITVTPIVISFVFAVGTGLFFGIYPARKAAKLDPIEALRYE